KDHIPWLSAIRHYCAVAIFAPHLQSHQRKICLQDFEERKRDKRLPFGERNWLRGLDLNQRPSGYEPDELPGCSTPRSYYGDAGNEIKPKSFVAILLAQKVAHRVGVDNHSRVPCS